MSMARKCDRCKKFFEPNVSWNGHANAYYVISINVETDEDVLDSLFYSDLCPECHNELRKWMKMEE